MTARVMSVDAEVVERGPGLCGCNVTDTDRDKDTHADCSDNCPLVPNAAQADFDNDTIGDPHQRHARHRPMGPA